MDERVWDGEEKQDVSHLGRRNMAARTPNADSFSTSHCTIRTGAADETILVCRAEIRKRRAERICGRVVGDLEDDTDAETDNAEASRYPTPPSKTG